MCYGIFQLEGPGEVVWYVPVALCTWAFSPLVDRNLPEGEGAEEETLSSLTICLVLWEESKLLSLNLACSELKIKSTII